MKKTPKDDSGSSNFSTGDIINLESLAAKLKHPPPKDGVSAYLKGELSVTTRELLVKYTSGADPHLQEALIGEFNRIIQGDCIFDRQRFEGSKLSPTTRRQLDVEAEDRDLVQLNRFLLEDAYPKELLKIRDKEDCLWPMTDWSGVRRAAEEPWGAEGRLNQLIERYQQPLKVFLLKKFEKSPVLQSRADELLQDFLQDKMLREGWLGKANREAGRFRNFLKKCLENFVKDWLRKNNVKGLVYFEDFDGPERDKLEAEIATLPDADRQFELDCVRSVLGETLARMKKDCETPDKNQPNRSHKWEIFQLRLLKPMLEGSEPAGYEDLVARFGIVSPAAAQNLLATAKRIFIRYLKEVIAEDTGARAALEEIELMKRFLAAMSEREKAPKRMASK